jgi:Glycosyltransferases involved in cell wall biogenesis
LSDKYLKDIAVIIPAYEPDENMIRLIGELKDIGFSFIIIINDGSSSEADSFFISAEKEYGCTVISHAVNLGKGRALKTAFNHVLAQMPDCLGIVTIDADGQHKAEDAAACAEALYEHPDMLVLGTRHFESKDVPPRNKFGNVMTRRIMKFLCGIDVADTQTGLRAMSRRSLSLFLPLSGERYEFELNMLLEAHGRGMPFYQVPIEPVYLDGNSSSHFNPLTDSARVYYLLIKFILASLFSFLVDITVFTLLIYVLKEKTPESYIVIATAIARAMSASLNYMINKNKVFRTKGNYVSTALKYVILCIILMAASAISVDKLYIVFHINETLIKIIVDGILFLMSFEIQHKWIFLKNQGLQEEFHKH